MKVGFQNMVRSRGGEFGTHILEIPANILTELQDALWRALGSPLPGPEQFGEIIELKVRTDKDHSIGFEVRRLEES